MFLFLTWVYLIILDWTMDDEQDQMEPRLSLVAQLHDPKKFTSLEEVSFSWWVELK